jgi:hypothetical protein
MANQIEIKKGLKKIDPFDYLMKQRGISKEAKKIKN